MRDCQLRLQINTFSSALQKMRQAQEMVDYTVSVALFYHDLFHFEIPNFDLSPSTLSTVFYFYSSTN